MDYGTDRYKVIMVDDFESWSPARRIFDHLVNALAYAKGLNDKLDEQGLDQYGRWFVLDTTDNKLINDEGVKQS